ncbi:Ribosomal RNA small subunit methyltransferase H [Glycine max]|nr:Ribosomal RNA small subunit methyltransferase H [Glycine max]
MKQVIRGHPELKYLVGMDVDSLAHDIAQPRLDAVLNAGVKAITVLRNFRDVKSVLREIAELHLLGVDAILMDLGMSSMQVDDPARGFSVLGDGPLDMRMDPQASLKAEDILNSWPDSEVGRILREYGEESNWRTLQKKIVNARLHGGLQSTSDLLDLIRRVTPPMKGGRQGWIKMATRVFQALRIAVNDELKTLEDSLYSCFDCLAPGGRLAVISFHSLEDRIVKQTFLNIIKGREDVEERESLNSVLRNTSDEIKEKERGLEDRIVKQTFLNIIKGREDVEERESLNSVLRNTSDEIKEKEAWIKQVIYGSNGTILTKRPITPSGEEEKLNRRTKAILLSNKWYGHEQFWVTRSYPTIQKFSHGKMDLKVKAATSLNSNAKKKANLFAEKKERIRLPTYNDDLGGKKYHISEFLSQPSGIAAVLNTKALQSFESLDANTYRCELPKLQFLNFEAAAIVGSAAFMRNQMTWGGAGAESFLEVDVKLNLTLEIYTQPFTMMPTSAVEGPGNIMMQALVDKLVPLLLQQMLQDYDEWVRKQSYSLKSF